MSGRSITHFLKVNSNLTSAARATREFRLPRMNPFPKLDRHAVVTAPPQPGRDSAGGGIAPTSLGGGEPLPEMVTDLIDPSARYGAENVRRACAAPQLAPQVFGVKLRPRRRVNGARTGFGLGQWMGRILGGHRAARP